VGNVRLLGEHISYSASPQMQAGAFKALNLDHTYELADVPAAELRAAVAALRQDGCLGANVTAPHKRAVMEYLDEVEPLAARAEAVNTIVSQNGRLIGSNTDVPAIADELRTLMPSPGRAVVLGAGGAAGAVRLALLSAGAKDTAFVSRSTWSYLAALVAKADLIVNATPIGTTSEESPIDQRHLHSGLAVLDLVYRPSPSRLVREAHECGLQARGGAGVLLGQGWRSLEAWLGDPVDGDVKDAMADALRRELGPEADV
jgi:shikimate dehydrogenase